MKIWHLDGYFICDDQSLDLSQILQNVCPWLLLHELLLNSSEAVLGTSSSTYIAKKIYITVCQFVSVLAFVKLNVLIVHCISQMFWLIWYFCPPIKSFPRTWIRQMCIFNGLKSIVAGYKLFRAELPFAIDVVILSMPIVHVI